MKSLVSIVVPCYNQAQYLDEALQSLNDQTHTNWECIIVNDGSLDNTAEIANKWVIKDSRFVCFNKDNGGVSSARNYGIENAKAEFILTLDADDKYEATFLEKSLAVLVNNEDIGIVSSWGRRYLTNGKPLQEFKSKAQCVSDFLFGNGLHMGSSFFRRECWEKSGGYDADPRNGYEDWEFYLGVCKLGWKVHVIEEFLFFYRQHTEASRRTTMNRQYKDNMAFIYIKHKDLYLSHYEDFVNHFLDSIVSEKREYFKIKNKQEYKIGIAILLPFRFVKKVIKMIFV